MGNPVLLRPAQPVADPGAPEIAELIGDMIETMEAAGGIGLAAPQIAVPLRVVIFHQPAESDADDDSQAEGPLMALINPEITPLGDEMVEGWEACLSVPGLCGRVPRLRHIRYRGLTPQGERISREAHDFHARVVQHECDHLDGILYPQRMTDLATLMFASEARHHGEETEPV